MLAKDLRRLGRLLIPLALIGWGLFALLFSGHLDSVPAPVWWLAIVLSVAVGLTALVALRFRARARQKDRW
jgi:membrane protein implicated in regulation of membrane protease activity